MTARDWFTHDDFAGRIGEPFALSLPDGSVLELRLHGAGLATEAGGEGPDGTVRQQFSLVFTGPTESALGQATRELRHAELGELTLFLVPIGAGPDGIRYEAAFA